MSNDPRCVCGIESQARRAFQEARFKEGSAPSSACGWGSISGASRRRLCVIARPSADSAAFATVSSLRFLHFPLSSCDVIMSSSVPTSLRDLRVGTVAGSAERGREGEATFHWPLGMALTPQGDLLVANYLGHNIRLIDTKGVVTTYAGTGQQGFQNGQRELATFSGPSSIVLLANGDLLVTDVLNNCLRKVSKDGSVTIFAGTGQQGFKNGAKEQATFFYPFGMVRTSQGHILVLDKGNHSVRLIYADTGVVTTYAGCGVAGCKDGAKEKAMFNTPYGICLVPETRQRSKSSFRTSGGGASSLHSHTSLASSSNSLLPVVASPIFELYIADSGNHRICHIDPLGNVSTMAGVSGTSGFVDGPKDVAKFNGPRSILLTPHGDLLVSDQGNQRIRIIETNGLVSTFAGCDRAGCVDGPRDRASFSSPSELCLSPSGDLYISDFTNNKIRHIKCPMWDITASNQKGSPVFNLQTLLADDCPSQLSDFSISLPGSRGFPAITATRATNDASTTTSTPIGAGASAQVALGSSSSSAAHVWMLHKIVILNRCPSLLTSTTIERLQRTSFSREALNAFVRYIYCDELPELSLPHLFDLDFLLNATELPQLSDHVRWIIHQRLGEVSPDRAVESHISLLGHVARHCDGSPVLVDLILARLRQSRAAVAENTKTIFGELANDQSLLIRVVSKLLGDSTLSNINSTCTYSAMTLNINECTHFGLFAEQLNRLFEARFIDEHSQTLPLDQQNHQYHQTSVDTNKSSASKVDEGGGLRSGATLSQSEEMVVVVDVPVARNDAREEMNTVEGVGGGCGGFGFGDELDKLLRSDTAEPDFVIRVGDSSLPCHKAILYGRWPYFANAMKMGGSEFVTNELELPEDTFSPSLMRALLQYFYSGHVSGLDSDSDCLTVLQHSLLFGFIDSENEPKPSFEQLMMHCRRPLAKPLNPNNCVSVLKSVLKYGNAHQQYKVRSFVARVLPDIMNDDKLAAELEELGSAENMRILFEQYGRQTASPARGRPS